MISSSRGGKRNNDKTKVIIYAPDQLIEDNKKKWGMVELAKIAAVVRPDDKDNMCLGVALGGAGNRQKQFEKKCQLIKELHQRLDKVGDTAAELSLLAKCGGVCKVTHLLRAAGDEMMPHTSLLKKFDDIQLGTLHRLFGGMDDLSDEQAKLGVNAGGLGIRAARDVALPAVLASKIMAEPKVEFMLQQLRIAGLITDDRLLTRFRKGIDQAVESLCEHLKQRAWG